MEVLIPLWRPTPQPPWAVNASSLLCSMEFSGKVAGVGAHFLGIEAMSYPDYMSKWGYHAAAAAAVAAKYDFSRV